MTAVDAISGEVLSPASVWLDQAVGRRIAGDLTKDDALKVTAKIKAYAGATWALLYAAHEHKAHKAMGYATWEDYVRAEFDMSRSRSYQLISQAKVVLEISAAVSTDVDTDGMSTVVDITEAEARDLAPALDEAKEAAAEAVADLPADATDDDKSSAVTSAMDRLRKAMAEKQRKERETAPTAGKEGSGPDTSAPSEPDPETVKRAVENATDPALAYCDNFTKGLSKAHGICGFDVDKAVATAGESLTGHRQQVESIQRWCEAYLKASRPAHLRSV